MDLITFLIISLAAWRIAYLLISEAGPFHILDRFRSLLGVRFENSEPQNFISELFGCLWCLSIWLGIGLAILYWYIPDYTTWLCLPFAISAAAIGVDRYVSN